MERALHDELLSFEHFWILFPFEKEIKVFSVFHIEVGEQGVQRREVSHMPSHICWKNQSNYSLPEKLEFFPSEDTDEICLVFVQYPEQLRHMEWFLGRYIIAVDRPSAYDVDMVGVREPIVPKIMARACDHHAQAVKLVQAKGVPQTTRCKHVEHHLHHICAVEVVVVYNLLFIGLVHPGQELQNSILIY